MKLRALAAPVLLIASSTAQASGDCPAREKGAYPWLIKEIIPGDRWAWVHLDIDTDGRPVACRLGKNNMTPGLRSTTCTSFVRNWKAVPVVQDGKPVRTTIKRFFVAMGDKHAKAEKEARKRFFLEHPQERPECYRD